MPEMLSNAVSQSYVSAELRTRLATRSTGVAVGGSAIRSIWKSYAALERVLMAVATLSVYCMGRKVAHRETGPKVVEHGRVFGGGKRLDR